MTTLTSPTYATPETLIYQAYKKQHDRKRRKSHNPGFIVSYPYVTNYMPSPFDPEGWSGASDPDGTLTNLTGSNPSGESFYGELEYVGPSSLGFANNFGDQISINTGQRAYAAIIYKTTGLWDASVQYSVNTDQGAKGFTRFDLDNKTKIDGTIDDFLFTDLEDGWVLLQCYEEALEDLTGAFGAFILQDSVNYPTQPPTGSQLYVQAVFFGKADNYPANVMPTL